MRGNVINAEKFDPVKALTLLTELWAHQNGYKIEEIKITKKEEKKGNQ